MWDLEKKLNLENKKYKKTPNVFTLVSFEEMIAINFNTKLETFGDRIWYSKINSPFTLLVNTLNKLF